MKIEDSFQKQYHSITVGSTQSTNDVDTTRWKNFAPQEMKMSANARFKFYVQFVHSSKFCHEQVG